MNSDLPRDPVVDVAVGTTIGVSGELSPPQAASAIPAPTATARTTKCLTRHIRARKVARIKEGTGAPGVLVSFPRYSAGK